MDSDTTTQLPGMPNGPRLHEPFLERAAGGDERDGARHALGAFLTMRLVDQFAAASDDTEPGVVAYQTTATGEFVEELSPQNVEASHLREIVRVADAAHKTNDPRMLWSPLLAFAYWLEQELRLAEALDVLDSTLQLSDGRDGEEEVTTHLQQARVLRLSGRFDDARSAYEQGGMMAARLGDTHSELLSRIGRGIVLRQVGNLPESQKVLREVIAEAERLGDRDAEARACQDLAATLSIAGRPNEAVPLAFRAFQLHERPFARIRALGDMGLALKELGLHAAAEHAFSLVLSGNPVPEIRVGTVLELLELSALAHDRVSFERWRRELLGHPDLTAEERVDFELKVGMGLSQFGNRVQGETYLRRALAHAEQHGMGERIFHIEMMLQQVRERRAPREEAAALPVEQVAPDTELDSTIERLQALEAM